MIPRLVNIQRLYDEVSEHGLDCVRISSVDSKGSALGSRTGITPNEVNSVIRQTLSDFNGELVVEVWRKDGKGDRFKYVINGGAGAGGAVNGAAVGALHPSIERMMQANYDLKLEVEKMKMVQANGAEVNYMPQALQMFQTLINGRNGVHHPPVVPPAVHAVAGADQDEGEEDDDGDEPDVFDEYAEADPEAPDVIERILQLKVKNPALYAQTKQMLKDLTAQP